MSPYREAPPGQPEPPPFRRSALARWWRRTWVPILRLSREKNPYCPTCQRRHTDWTYLSSGPFLCWKCFERRAIPAMQRYLATKSCSRDEWEKTRRIS